MTKPKTSVFLKLEQKITASSSAGILARWKYGREVLKAKAGGKKIPDGMIDLLIKEAEAAGISLSRREIQYRVRCAEVYATEGQLRKITCTIGSWTEIINAGFPAVESDEPEDLADGITAAPDEWEQLSLIPGLGEELRIRGRSVLLADATVADVAAYRDMYAEMHANYAKRLALIENALRIMREADSDPEANALDAWKRGVAS